MHTKKKKRELHLSHADTIKQILICCDLGVLSFQLSISNGNVIEFRLQKD